MDSIQAGIQSGRSIKYTMDVLKQEQTQPSLGRPVYLMIPMTEEEMLKRCRQP